MRYHLQIIVPLAIAVFLAFSAPSAHAIEPNQKGAEQQVLEWLDAIPQIRRDVPPPDNFSEVQDAWVERGKQITVLLQSLISVVFPERVNTCCQL